MEFISNHKKVFFISAVIICVALAIVTARFKQAPTFIEDGLSYIIAPLQTAATTAGRWVSGKINVLVEIEDLAEINAKLTTRIEELEMDNTRLKLIEKENEKLSALLQIDSKYAEHPKVGAEIIAKDMGNWYDRFTIGKGITHGINKNDVVMASGGLVGIIDEAGPISSKVVSLIDSSSSIAAKSLRTDDSGFVKGDLDLLDEGYCRMDYIDLSAQIMEGDEIVTSQLSDIYPPGITIGTVKSIQLDNNGLTKYAIIIPSVDFKHLETVLVIKQKELAN